MATLLPQRKSKQVGNAKTGAANRVTGLPVRTSSGKTQLLGGGDKFALSAKKKR